jgi:predicted AAA+ superfamily ATPase
MKASDKTRANTPPRVERVLNLPALLQKKSHFLLGPRQTGKTFLIQHTLASAIGGGQKQILARTSR